MPLCRRPRAAGELQRKLEGTACIGQAVWLGQPQVRQAPQTDAQLQPEITQFVVGQPLGGVMRLLIVGTRLAGIVGKGWVPVIRIPIRVGHVAEVDQAQGQAALGGRVARVLGQALCQGHRPQVVHACRASLLAALLHVGQRQCRGQQVMAGQGVA